MTTATDIVLGGGGFVGRHLAGYLAGKGRPVTVVGRSVHGAAIPGIRQVSLDLYTCSAGELEDILAPAEVIYHLAWSNLPAAAEGNVEGDLTANVGFVARLLSTIKGSQKRLVFCSSGGTVYGKSDVDAIPEDHPLRPINAYGASKVAAEIYCGLFHDAYGVDVRVARLANPFGFGQSQDRLQGAASRFVQLAVEGQPIEIWGDGRVVRDYIEIGDAVAGLHALGSAALNADSPRTFNIATGIGTDLNHLVEMIEKAFGRSVQVKYFPGRRIDAPQNVLSINRAQAYLTWRPLVTVEQGIRRLVELSLGGVAKPGDAGVAGG